MVCYFFLNLLKSKNPYDYTLVYSTDMKKITLFALGLVFSCSVFAQKFISAKIDFKDGKQLTGFADVPENVSDKDIEFRVDSMSHSARYKSNEIKSIVYFNIEGDTVQFDRKRYFVGWKVNRPGKEVWLQVLVTGRVTLYYHEGVTSTFSGSGGSNVNFDRYWSCVRAGEQAVTIVAWAPAGLVLNSSILFKDSAPQYFSDDRELSQKIADKSTEWTNIEQVVKEYNEKVPTK